MKNRYKPFLVFFNILFDIFKISLAAFTLCVRRMSAPYIIEISSAAMVPYNRSPGLSFCKISPMNDLLETETNAGNLFLIKRKFWRTARSLETQLELIFVNGIPVPLFLKKQLPDQLQYYPLKFLPFWQS